LTNLNAHKYVFFLLLELNYKHMTDPTPF